MIATSPSAARLTGASGTGDRSLGRLETLVVRNIGLVQNAWRALLSLTLGLFVLAVPARAEELREIAANAERAHGDLLARAPDVMRLAASPEIYPYLVVGLEISFVLALLVASAGIAWGRLNDWRNLFFSAVFVTYSVWVTPTLDALTEGTAPRHFISLLQAVGLIFAIHFFLLFPDGRFYPRWTRISSAFWIVYTLAWGIYPDAPFSLLDPFDVPFGTFAALMFGWVTGLVAQAFRYRSHATSEQRKQTKWVLIAIGGAVAAYGAVYLPGVFIGDSGIARVGFELFSVPIFWVLAIPMSFALGGAMLRHHLFDFNGVVNKTLVYGSLTSTLALVYFGMVALLQQVLHPFAGTSDLAIAGSTLTVSVLFRPARARIQRVIDRRFYRSQYDANKALDRFARRLRSEIDLGSVEQELLTIVSDTMQPCRASLWLIDRKDALAATAHTGAGRQG